MLDDFLPANKNARTALFIGLAAIPVLVICAVILSFPQKKPEKNESEKKTDTDISLAIEDLCLDKELPWFYEPLFYPSRNPETVWQKEEVSRYFIPVSKILLSYFRKYNDNLIKEIFSKID